MLCGMLYLLLCIFAAKLYLALGDEYVCRFEDNVGCAGGVITIESKRYIPYKKWTRTEYTFTDFEVAGVNLAAFQLGDENEAVLDKDAKPFELFEDFDIGPLILGNRTMRELMWWCKMSSEWQSLLFYDDKVAFKRWLPSINLEIPKTFALLYASELENVTSPGDVESQANAILQLLPKGQDYVAKPSHQLRSQGVWVVKQGGNGMLRVSKDAAGPLRPKRGLSNRVVARKLAEKFNDELSSADSPLQGKVKPGLVVEERFVALDTKVEEPALEFKVVTLWGKVYLATWRHGGFMDQWTPGSVYRNGTMVNGSTETSLPEWVDWPRVVEIAERMGAHKDFLRTDIFVGVPAGSPSLRKGASKGERRDAVQYVVNEISSTSSEDVPMMLQEEGVRLWIAGYKMGNYRVVPNSEVPREFLQHEADQCVQQQEKERAGWSKLFGWIRQRIKRALRVPAAVSFGECHNV